MKKTVDLVIRFRTSEETLLLAGAISQGCKVQALGGGLWKISGVPEKDLDDLIGSAVYYQKLF